VCSCAVVQVFNQSIRHECFCIPGFSVKSFICKAAQYDILHVSVQRVCRYFSSFEFGFEVLTQITRHAYCDVYLVHVGSVRQTATIVSMSKDHLRTGDKAVVRFRFIKGPEYLRPDVRLVFREGRTKAVGTVTRTIAQTVVPAGAARLPRTAPSSSKRETGQGSGQGLPTPQRPQNEPQKPSKRNRRGRGTSTAYKSEAATVSVDVAKIDHTDNAVCVKLESKPSLASSSIVEVTVQVDSVNRVNESIPLVSQS